MQGYERRDFMEEKLNQKTKEILNDMVSTKVDIDELMIKMENQ